MLSSYLAGLGLEAIANGEPNIASLITQGQVIEKFKSIHQFKEIWEKAERIARQHIDENGVVRIQLVHISFVENKIETINDDFDLSIVDSHTILSTKNANSSDFVKADVLILLFS